MRLYKITATTDDGPSTKYVGSQSDAATHRKELLEKGATRKGTETFEVDVPTDKAGLMDFLNNLVAGK